MSDTIASACGCSARASVDTCWLLAGCWLAAGRHQHHERVALRTEHPLGLEGAGSDHPPDGGRAEAQEPSGFEHAGALVRTVGIRHGRCQPTPWLLVGASVSGGRSGHV